MISNSEELVFYITPYQYDSEEFCNEVKKHYPGIKVIKTKMIGDTTPLESKRPV